MTQETDQKLILVNFNQQNCSDEIEINLNFSFIDVKFSAIFEDSEDIKKLKDKLKKINYLKIDENLRELEKFVFAYEES
jgi:hypothetical protein